MTDVSPIDFDIANPGTADKIVAKPIALAPRLRKARREIAPGTEEISDETPKFLRWDSRK
jgi:predicted secreted protein